jgi:hypothetical protein
MNMFWSKKPFFKKIQTKIQKWKISIQIETEYISTANLTKVLCNLNVCLRALRTLDEHVSV